LPNLALLLVIAILMTSIDVGHAKQLEHDIRMRFIENPRDAYPPLEEILPPPRRRIPPLPDLRFESSYLRSIRAYVHVERLKAERRDEKGKGIATGDETSEGLREVVTVQWGKVVWVTTRDQILSPLLQGAVWGVVGYFLRPAMIVLKARIRAWWARGAIYSPNGRKQEGLGVGWLRNWVGGFASNGVKTNLVR